MKISWVFLFIQIVIMRAEDLKKWINDLNAYSIKIFTNHLKISNDQISFLKNLMTNCPATLIDLIIKRIEQITTKRRFSKITNDPTLTLYFHVRNWKFSDIFNDIIKISPASTRPKTLFLATNTREEKNILIKAWSLKFLDFSIIKINSDGNYTFMTYNPFFEKFYWKWFKIRWWTISGQTEKFSWISF